MKDGERWVSTLVVFIGQNYESCLEAMYSIGDFYVRILKEKKNPICWGDKFNLIDFQAPYSYFSFYSGTTLI